MARTTLLDLAKLNGADAVVGLIEESLAAAPEMATIPGRAIAGTSYRTVLRTGLPTTGFRRVNEGVTASKSTFESKLVECFIAGGRVEVDRAIAEAYEDGPEALQAIEAAGVMESALRRIGSQVFYGIAADAKGFPGLQAMCSPEHAVNAGGSTAKTSAYAVRFGPQAVQFVFGRNSPFVLSPWREETIYDAALNPLPGYVADLSAWVGLQCVSAHAVGRIYNIGTDSGKGMTDALVAELLSKWYGPAPDVIFVNRRSAFQLQTSRTVSIISDGTKKVLGGVGTVAPMPTESNGIPIVITDQITNAES